MSSYSDTGVKITNYREIIKDLKQIGVPNEVIKDAGKLAGERVLREAKELVPVRSGALRDTIRLSATASGKVTIRAGNNVKVPYANPIHWGWFKRMIKPNPFFAKALGYSRDEIFRTYFNSLEEYITKISIKGRN